MEVVKMELNEVCTAYALGEPQVHKNLAIVPVNAMKVKKDAKRGAKREGLDYIVLNEGIQQGKVHIQETGSVNQLWISNNSDKDVFVMKGEYVVGGKQNRMITVNGLIAANTGRMYIPVHCVQHHRWDDPKVFGLGNFAASANLRSSVMKSESGQGGQQRTWGYVSCFLETAGVRSHTSNFDDAYKGKQNDVQEYLNAFRKESGQLGAIAVVQYRNGQTQLFVDMFDQAGTFGKHYERLLASYAIDAAVQGVSNSPQASKADAERFLTTLIDAQTKESQSICLGTDHEVQADGMQGAALVYQNTMIYLGGKNNAVPGARPGQDPRIPLTIRRSFI
jgi:hypothetical protein